MKTIIAVDVAIGKKRKKIFESMGYEVVVCARDSETDESWLNRAFAAGAQYIVSPDMDIPRLIENNRYPMVWINFPVHEMEMKDLLTDYVNDSIEHKKRLFTDLTSEPKVLVKEGPIARMFRKLF